MRMTFTVRIYSDEERRMMLLDHIDKKYKGRIDYPELGMLEKGTNIDMCPCIDGDSLDLDWNTFEFFVTPKGKGDLKGYRLERKREKSRDRYERIENVISHVLGK